MAQVNPLTREVLVKLVYYGPGLCGKTTSLQKIHASSPPETRGQIVSLATPVDRTLYFDFLPLRAQSVRGHHLRLQLFTVPGQVYFNATRKLVLTGSDGVIFVADSQRDRMDANLESLENLASNLEDHDRSLANIPLVLQYNKRDLPTALDVEEMNASLNALGVPVIESNASKGEGVLEALDTLVRLVLDDLERRNVLGSVRPPPPTPKFGRADAGFAAQVEMASQELKLPDEPSTREREFTPLIAPASPPSSVPPTLTNDGSVEMSSLSAEMSEGDRTSEGDIMRATVAPPSGLPSVLLSKGPRFTALFPDDEADVASLEEALDGAEFARVVEHAGGLVRRMLRQAGSEAEIGEAGSHPALLAPLIGLEPQRYLAFERVVRRAETGGPIDEKDALRALALMLEVRSRLDRAY